MKEIKRNQAVTLIELVIALILLSAVVMTGYTLELAMRRMQVKPNDQAKLLNELIPVMERIDKDFNRQVGSRSNTSAWREEDGARLIIRVDYDNDAKVSSGDHNNTYRWVPDNHWVLFSENNFTTSDSEVIARSVSYFNVTLNSENTVLEITMRARKKPELDANPRDNPEVNLTKTIFSRMTSGS